MNIQIHGLAPSDAMFKLGVKLTLKKFKLVEPITLRIQTLRQKLSDQLNDPARIDKLAA